MSCVFCTDPASAGAIVHDDAIASVILHDDWSPRGHAMVVAKRHVENASDLAGDELAHLTRVWTEAERVLLALTGSERAILLKLGIATPHLHLHVYPAKKTDPRTEIFAMFDAQRGEVKDERFVEEVRRMLQASLTRGAH